jgi:hypothetical protein
MVEDTGANAASRKLFLELLWEAVNASMQEHWIDNCLRMSEKERDVQFGDAGSALARVLALGASRRDLSLLVRFAMYEGAFTALSLLEDPGVPDNERESLHESLLTADPSGKDARPGSAPYKG